MLSLSLARLVLTKDTFECNSIEKNSIVARGEREADKMLVVFTNEDQLESSSERSIRFAFLLFCYCLREWSFGPCDSSPAPTENMSSSAARPCFSQDTSLEAATCIQPLHGASLSVNVRGLLFARARHESRFRATKFIYH